MSPFGEVLVDPTSIPLFTTSAAAVGAVASHDMAIPYVASAMGLTLSSQGLILSSGLSLSNALDLTLGVGSCP